jgi:hypothetical protein
MKLDWKSHFANRTLSPPVMRVINWSDAIASG